jgi:dinuclear metal center YbgI/SA1388 family protein
MHTGKIVDICNRIFPFTEQEDFDNAGPQVLFSGVDTDRVLIALDCDRQVLQEARDLNCRCIITHHPVIFRGLKTLRDDDARGRLIMEMVRREVSCIALHTNLDRAFYDRLGRSLGFEPEEVIFERPGGLYPGLGSLSTAREALSLGELLERISRELEVENLRYGGDPGRRVNRLAFFNGSGKGAVENIIRLHHPDVIVTGDLTYHTMKEAEEWNVALVDAGHFATERLLLPFLARELEAAFQEEGEPVTCSISKRERDPFQVYTG